MEKRNHFLKSIFVLIALICASVTASGQNISSPASCTTDEPQQVALRSTNLSVPMAPQPGDVNADGQIDISDVVVLVNYILTGNADNIHLGVADINDDDSIDISDVVGLVNIILGQ